MPPSYYPHLSIFKNLVKSGKKKSPRKQEPTMSDASGGVLRGAPHFPPGRVPSLPRGFERARIAAGPIWPGRETLLAKQIVFRLRFAAGFHSTPPVRD
jgi:hypothetical protein